MMCFVMLCNIIQRIAMLYCYVLLCCGIFWYGCMYVCKYVCMNVNMYVCMYVCMYLFIYLCFIYLTIYLSIYMFIYLFIFFFDLMLSSLIWSDLLSCYVMLCHVMSCYVMSCYVMLCHVMLCHVVSCYVMLCHVMLCHVMSCHVRYVYIRLSMYILILIPPTSCWHADYISAVRPRQSLQPKLPPCQRRPFRGPWWTFGLVEGETHRILYFFPIKYGRKILQHFPSSNDIICQ